MGKTSLVRRFCDEEGGSARVLWGNCDALFTPRPLGPLLPAGVAAEPYSLSIAGEWRRAAERWSEIGCRYEAALALADSDDELVVRQSIDERCGSGSPDPAGSRRSNTNSAPATPRLEQTTRAHATRGDTRR